MPPAAAPPKLRPGPIPKYPYTLSPHHFRVPWQDGAVERILDALVATPGARAGRVAPFSLQSTWLALPEIPEPTLADGNEMIATWRLRAWGHSEQIVGADVEARCDANAVTAGVVFFMQNDHMLVELQKYRGSTAAWHAVRSALYAVCARALSLPPDHADWIAPIIPPVLPPSPSTDDRTEAERRRAEAETWLYFFTREEWRLGAVEEAGWRLAMAAGRARPFLGHAPRLFALAVSDEIRRPQALCAVANAAARGGAGTREAARAWVRAEGAGPVASACSDTNPETRTHAWRVLGALCMWSWIRSRNLDAQPGKETDPLVLRARARACRPMRAWARLRRLAPSIGRWRRALWLAYMEVACRPGRSLAREAGRRWAAACAEA